MTIQSWLINFLYVKQFCQMGFKGVSIFLTDHFVSVSLNLTCIVILLNIVDNDAIKIRLKSRVRLYLLAYSKGEKKTSLRGTHMWSLYPQNRLVLLSGLYSFQWSPNLVIIRSLAIPVKNEIPRCPENSDFSGS